MTIEDLKELGAVILMPNAEAYKKLLGGQNTGYTRVYFQGIRVMFGNFNWSEYMSSLGIEKIILDDTEVK